MRVKTRFFSLIIFIFFLQTVLISTVFATTKIMPLGDSITQGFSSGEPDEDRQVSYRKALWDKLQSGRYDVEFVGSLNSGFTIFGSLDPAFHEGHPGWTDDEIVNGRPIVEPDAGKLDEWLNDHRPDIVLLHIGTNGLDPDPDQVEDILNVIDAYSTDTWVILALIINRLGHVCPDPSVTTDFNGNVFDMANDRITAGDKIIIVDMECGAGIDYVLQPAGDMNDNLHPYQDPTTGEAPGYAKMADVWFSALEQILPDPDPDPPNNSSSSNSGCFIGTAAY